MERFEYTPENLRKLQLVELEILKEFDRICRKHGINYIIDAGTLLGAVRHGGFIPWDDDIDIRMLRDDYDRFCAICKRELDQKFFLQTYETDPGYRWGFSRILKKDTRYIRKNYEELTAKTGIFIDIFPSDNLPETNAGYKLCTCVSWFCRKLLYAPVGYKYAKTFWSRLGFRILRCFPESLAYKGFDFLVKKYKDCNTSKVRCFGWGSTEETIGYKKEWLENTCDIKFEDLMVKAPSEAKEFLIHSYGEDYMTPPPVDKRTPNHLAEYIVF